MIYWRFDSFMNPLECLSIYVINAAFFKASWYHWQKICFRSFSTRPALILPKWPEQPTFQFKHKVFALIYFPIKFEYLSKIYIRFFSSIWKHKHQQTFLFENIVKKKKYRKSLLSYIDVYNPVFHLNSSIHWIKCWINISCCCHT